jgi:hypothetical protein
MYCPRCGLPDADTTKFCRQCGLALTPIAGYVASGGTGQLPATRSSSSLPLSSVEWMTPKQNLVLTIMLLVLFPGIFGVLGTALGFESLGGSLAGISGILMPIGIVWSVFRYKAQMRLLQQQQMQLRVWTAPPVTPPAFQPQSYQQPLAPLSPPTNPLATPVAGSVTEDETQRFPGQNR